ncbi:MAG: diaminopimelate epimerase [Saprospiraceae bacterium]
MEIPFVKYQGTGNDFIIINAFRDRDIISRFDKSLVRHMCDRHFGIGADGLILLAQDDELEFKMIYFNSDGAESSMCGNGGRCLAHFAHKLGIVGARMHFNAFDGPHEALIGDEVSLKMMDVLDYSRVGEDYVLDTGSPHYVRFVSSLVFDDFIYKARDIRYSDSFHVQGINVNFAVLKDEAVHMRTYERGVENETLSCGTGVVATSLASFLESGEKMPVPIHVVAPGGRLSVDFKFNAKQFTDIWLRGPAQEVFKGLFVV